GDCQPRGRIRRNNPGDSRGLRRRVHCRPFGKTGDGSVTRQELNSAADGGRRRSMEAEMHVCRSWVLALRILAALLCAASLLVQGSWGRTPDGKEILAALSWGDQI